jgi:hypothetical protein
VNVCLRVTGYLSGLPTIHTKRSASNQIQIPSLLNASFSLLPCCEEEPVVRGLSEVPVVRLPILLENTDEADVAIERSENTDEACVALERSENKDEACVALERSEDTAKMCIAFVPSLRGLRYLAI